MSNHGTSSGSLALTQENLPAKVQVPATEWCTGIPDLPVLGGKSYALYGCNN